MTTQSQPLVCSIPTGGQNPERLVSFAGDLPLILRDSIPSQDSFEAFFCDVRQASPATPDRVDPDVEFVLGVHSGGEVVMPDGVELDFMSFHHWTPESEIDDDAFKDFPGPLLRVTEGQVVHTTLIPSRNTHTIHHHGIEPTPHNDGVGHTSFEVSDRYTYQWRPSSAGTYFYHCHKNTVLHFELGMYGGLIVDPPSGPGYVRRMTEEIPYDQEVMWIADDVDPVWHQLDHQAGITCPWDNSEHLLTFDPKYFMISGVPHPRSRTDSNVAVDATAGELVLLRLLNAAYGPISVRVPMPVEVIAADGHTLGGPKDGRYSWPWTKAPNDPIFLTTAQRWDMLLDTTHVPAGTYTVEIDFHHWITLETYGRAETTITVS